MNTKYYDMKFLHITLVLLIAAIVSTSCTENNGIAPSEDFASVNEFFELNEKDYQSFTIDAGQEAELFADEGSVVTIPANAFTDHQGNAITGSIQLRVKELITNADFLFAGQFPISDGAALNTAAQVFVHAYQDGEMLHLRDDEFIKIEVPTEHYFQGMEIYLAGQYVGKKNLNWQSLESSQMISNSMFMYRENDAILEIDMDFMGWVSIAEEVDASNVAVDFELADVGLLDSTEIQAFAVLSNENSVVPFEGLEFTEISPNTIEVSGLSGVDMNVIVLATRNLQLYYGTLNLDPNNNSDYIISMKSVTSDEVEAGIVALP